MIGEAIICVCFGCVEVGRKGSLGASGLCCVEFAGIGSIEKEL